MFDPSMFRTAREIYLALKDDAAAIVALRAEYATLSLALMTGDNAGIEVTSATVNGQSFSGQVSMTKSQRLKLIGLVIQFIDAGGNISSVGRATL